MSGEKEPITDTNRADAIDDWVNDQEEAIEVYGHISDWDTSQVTDMTELLAYDTITDDISRWDVSNVTNMSHLFYSSGFNQDISNWDVSKVTNMEHMFDQNPEFNQNINGWNVSRVTNMDSMFRRASRFNQNLGDWDVSSVTDMGNMFREATAFNGDISGWNTAAVESMEDMFNEARAFNQNISGWRVENVVYAGGMFTQAEAFNQPIGGWNTHSMTDMSGMFDGALAFNQPLAEWNVSGVAFFGRMFYGARSFNQDLSQWDISQHASTVEMFDLSAYSYETPHIYDTGDPTEQAELHVQDYGHAEGVAFEVHNEFRQINVSRYTALLKARLDETGVVPVSYDRVEDTLKGAAATPAQIEKVEYIFSNALRNVAPDDMIQTFIRYTVSYVLLTDDFSRDDQRLYVDLWTSESVGAYTASETDLATQTSEEVSRRSLSCVQGIFERFILTVRSVIQQIGSPNPTQIAVLALLVMPEPGDIYNRWRNEGGLERQDAELYAAAQACRDNDACDFPPESLARYTQLFEQFARDVYGEYYSNPEDISRKLAEISSTIEYVATSVQDGGRGRRSRTTRRKTRQRSARKTKRKSKRNARRPRRSTRSSRRGKTIKKGRRRGASKSLRKTKKRRRTTAHKTRK